MPVVDAFAAHLEVPVVDFGCDSLVPGASCYHALRATVDNDGHYHCDTSELTFVGAFLQYETCEDVKKSTKKKKPQRYLHTALFQNQNEEIRINGKSFFVKEADRGKERQTLAEKMVKFRHLFAKAGELQPPESDAS
jgi:hypothetical protein